MVKKEQGQPVVLKLAGGVVAKGAMTHYGEIMPGANDEKSDIGWVVPVCRLTNELGMKMVWSTDKVTLED
eukprot:12886785-Prorocentrum_lima.AAC.1